MGRTLCQRSKHDRTVRYRLVARNGYLTPQRLRRSDDSFMKRLFAHYCLFVYWLSAFHAPRPASRILENFVPTLFGTPEELEKTLS